MATAYTQIREYKDPAKVDISGDIKAQSYLQNEYNVNKANAQQLVNNYLGTNLALQVDRDYLSEKISNLTDYINKAGSLDWSNKNISDTVTSYIGSALDKNVMNAIKSTQQIQAEDAERAEMWKKDPSTYSPVNEYIANMGRVEYMNSQEPGAKYQGSRYMPHVDYNKTIMDNASKAKDFGMDVKIDSTGNAFFTSITKIETLTPQKVSSFLDSVLSQEAKTQMNMDGIYAYRGTSTDELNSKFNDHLNSKAESYANVAKEMRLNASRLPKDNREEYLSKAKEYENAADEYNKYKSVPKDRNYMAGTLFSDNKKDSYINLLSFNRVVDRKIDDSGLKYQMYQHTLDKDAWDQQYKLSELDSKTKSKNKEDDASVLLTDSPLKELGEDIESKIATTTKDTYEASVANTSKTVVPSIESYLNSEQGRSTRERLGFKEGSDGGYILTAMIAEPEKYSDLIYKLPEADRSKVLEAQGSHKQYQSMLDSANDFANAAQKVSKSLLYSDEKKGKFKDNFELYTGGKYSVDANGNVVSKDVMRSDTPQDNAVRLVGVINNVIEDGNYTDDEIVIMREKQKQILNRVVDDPKKLSNVYKQFIGNVGASEKGKQIIRDNVNGKPVNPGLNSGSYLGLSAIDGVANYFTKDRNITDIDEGQLSGVSPSIATQLKGLMQKSKNSIVDNIGKYSMGKDINLSLNSKTDPTILAWLKQQAGVGADIQSDGTVSMSYVPGTNKAYISMPIKDGKTYEATAPIQVEVSNMPSALRDKIDNRKDESYYDANNKYAIGVQRSVGIPRNREEFFKDLPSDTPFYEKSALMNSNIPTQDSILASIKNIYDEKSVSDNIKDIMEIIKTPVTISNRAEKGQWVVYGSQNGVDVLASPTNKSVYKPEDLTESYYNKTAVSLINERIMQLLRDKGSLNINKQTTNK